MILELLHSLVYDFLTIIFTLIRLYRIVCYTNILVENLVFINPYYWPFSAFRILTTPYFMFWNRVFPPQVFRQVGLNFSSIIATEVLNAGIKGLFYLLKYMKPSVSL